MRHLLSHILRLCCSADATQTVYSRKTSHTPKRCAKYLQQLLWAGENLQSVFMLVRQATQNDIGRLVEIDKAAYGEYGADNRYFQDKFQFFPQGILVVEEDKKITGFTVIEFLEADQIPRDFSDFNPARKLRGKWMHIIAFTTASNYLDGQSDNELVRAAEKIGAKCGCVSSCVPLTITHPFEGHGVFDFWKQNEYQKNGNISWVVSPTEKLECYFYSKDL
jgi:hypothetical protein